MLQGYTVSNSCLLVVIRSYRSKVLYYCVVFEDFHNMCHLFFTIIIIRHTKDIGKMLAQNLLGILASSHPDVKIPLFSALTFSAIQKHFKDDAVPIQYIMSTHKVTYETTHHDVVCYATVLIIRHEVAQHLVRL